MRALLEVARVGGAFVARELRLAAIIVGVTGVYYLAVRSESFPVEMVVLTGLVLIAGLLAKW
jgi:hypothetical protein